MTATESTATTQEKRTGEQLLEALNLVDEAIRPVAEKLQDGEQPTSDGVKQARAELDGLEGILEEYVVANVDGLDPYETTIRNVTFGAMADALGVDLDDVNKLREQNHTE